MGDKIRENEEMLIRNGEIVIFSGEGIVGKIAKYKGKLTLKALKNRLTRERCGGDRWAHAWFKQHPLDPYCKIYSKYDFDRHEFVETAGLGLCEFED